jgi:alpha-L-rhamnosidase
VKGRRAFLGRLGAQMAVSAALPAAAKAQSSRKKKRPAARPRVATARATPPPAPPPPLPVITVAQGQWPEPAPGAPIDLAPARWIWLPCERTLANTFVLFRRELEVESRVASARGWVAADSRYRLVVNGRRVQWGPLPCDPRSGEADPLDLAPYLVRGTNVVGVEVLFYGHGEGTWPLGKPGLLFALRIEEESGRTQEVFSDGTWSVQLDRSHRPGQFKRWYLRSLQEEFDARLHPEGWSAPGYSPDESWIAPSLVDTRADRPAAAGSQEDYLSDARIDPATTVLRAREIPLLRETVRPLDRMVRSGRVLWKRDPRDWFEYRIPGCFEIVDETAAFPSGDGAFRLGPAQGEGAFAIFELPEQMVGFPLLTVDAPAGTVVELVAQESHDRRGPGWLDTNLFTWTRLVCREGENRFECFDYESLRFLQVHVRDASGPVLLRDLGVRRRVYAWPKAPSFRCGEPAVERVFEASFNTLVNAAEGTIVSGIRGRLPRGGDSVQVLHATRLVCGDSQLARRFLRTASAGQVGEGYFLDGWPDFDALNRVAQRQVGATPFGPTLDHGLTLVLAAWQHHLETGETDLPVVLYPRYARFFDYLLARRGRDGLLPAEDWGTPVVWIDEEFARARHKQCAFNLLAAAVLGKALAPLAAVAGDPAGEKRFAAAADALVAASVRRFWSRERGLFVGNLPWEDEEGVARLDDRSLATALLFDQCPDGRVHETVATLAEPPASLLMSGPAGAHWRMQALARFGRIDAVVRELRQRWAVMPSVVYNNTTSADWAVRPDSRDQWSQCAVGPLVVLAMDIAGIRPAEPGFAKVAVRPQLGDLPGIEATVHTPRGPVALRAEPQEEGHHAWVTLPPDCPGELILPAVSGRGVAVTPLDHAVGLERYALPAGETTEFDVPAFRKAFPA